MANIRSMRLEYVIGSGSPECLRTWQVSSSVGPEAHDEARLHVVGDSGIVEFQGNAEDLSRSLALMADEASRHEVKTRGEKAPRRIIWTLILMDGEYQTLGKIGVDWKPRKSSEPEVDADDPDLEPGIITASGGISAAAENIINMQAKRIRELETLHTAQVGGYTAALGSFMDNCRMLMDAHAGGTMRLVEGVLDNAKTQFELMEMRVRLELEGDDGAGFWDTPMGAVVMEHAPQLMNQAPELIAAVARALEAWAARRAAAPPV